VGQKVHPYGFRLGTLYGWKSNWFEDRRYGEQVLEDHQIRNHVKKKLYHAGISKVVIERVSDKCTVNIHTARPGILIGKRGAEIEALRKKLADYTSHSIYINVKEVRRAELDAQLVAENIALQLERRVAFRRAMKKAMTSTMKFGAKGIRLECGGRLGGTEMGRRERYAEGRVPLHTLRANVDYGVARRSGWRPTSCPSRRASWCGRNGDEGQRAARALGEGAFGEGGGTAGRALRRPREEGHRPAGKAGGVAQAAARHCAGRDHSVGEAGRPACGRRGWPQDRPQDGSQPVKRRGQRRTLEGVVVSDQMDKTVVVRVERLVKDPRYHKYVRRHSRFMAHDEQNDCGVGDRVRIIEHRAISKRKRWKVQAMVAKSSRVQDGVKGR